MKIELLIISSFAVFNIVNGQVSVTVTGTNNSCFGQCNGSATATASGGTPPYTYLWTPGGATTQTITGLCNGLYCCSVTDVFGPPAVTSCYNVTSPQGMQVNWSITNASCQTCCDGMATANVFGGTSPYTYQWCNGMSTQTASGLCVGCCYFSVTDANGCTQIDSACVSFTSGLSELKSSIDFSVYPNPFSSFIVIESEARQSQIEVYNVFGEPVYKSQIQKQKIEIDLDKIPSGIYFLQVKSENGITTRKIIKK